MVPLEEVIRLDRARSEGKRIRADTDAFFEKEGRLVRRTGVQVLKAEDMEVLRVSGLREKLGQTPRSRDGRHGREDEILLLRREHRVPGIEKRGGKGVHARSDGLQ